MKNEAFTFLTRALLALLIGGLFCGAALADTAYVVESVRVYQEPDTSSRSSSPVAVGTKLELVAEKSGWAMVQKNGITGYMKASALARVESCGGKTVFAACDAKVYKTCSTSSKKLGTVKAGTEMSLQATAGDWACVSLNGKKGFTKRSNLTTEAPAKPAAPTEKPVEPAETDPVEEIRTMNATAYAASDGVKAYKTWSTDSKVLATLTLNTQVTVTAVKGDWCRVERSGKTAFMKKGDLSASRIEAGTEPTAAPEVTPVPEAAPTPEPTATPEPAQVTELKYGDKGEAVVALQKRLKELGYFGGTLGGNYLEKTQAAVIAFQKAAGLTADGVAGPATLKALASGSAPKAPEEKQPEGGADDTTATVTVTSPHGRAKEMDWWTSDIQQIFARGTTAVITDIETGISWREIRKGGTNHADCQPVTAADTAAMKRACGSWSWNRRAIWVTINGVNYAASMNCMPHGSGSITTNNFNGHHCIHFTNSRTHGTNRVCPLHQAAIKKAAAASR